LPAPLKNLAIFTILKKTMDFFEVTGGLWLDSGLEGMPSRKAGIEPRRRKEHKVTILCPAG
jgi:hypothetical protein